MKKSNFTVKNIIAAIFFLFVAGAVQAIPACAFQKFGFSVEQVASSMEMNLDVPVSIVNIYGKKGDDYWSKLFIFNEHCGAIYQETSSSEPLSIFHLDDGFSGVIFNLLATPDGTYNLNAYRMIAVKRSVKFIKILNAMPSVITPSIYYSNQHDATPNIYGCINKIQNTDDEVIGYGDCSLYKFDDKTKRYALAQKMTIDTPPDIPKGKYRHTQTRRALEKCLRAHRCHIW